MKQILTITAILAIVFTGCTKDPDAHFAYSPKNPIAGEEVIFDNLSLDAVSYEWNFDDGTSTAAMNPVHIFQSGGTFEVQLKAFNKRGAFDVTSALITVVAIEPTASFTVYTDLPDQYGNPIPTETDIVYVGEQVEFFNTSLDAASYLWDFDDGYTSTLESPVTSFDTPGTYDITLTAYGLGQDISVMVKRIYVYEGINSTLRVTVLDVDEDYLPVEDVSVWLYNTLDDWDAQENRVDVEEFSTPLGKCVFEGLNQQRYYVDAYFNDNYNNWGLGLADAGWIETQVLDPGFIHDFFAYIAFDEGGKKTVKMERRGSKRIDLDDARKEKLKALKAGRITKYSKER